MNKRINNFETFLNESIYIDEFTRLYNLAPDELKVEVDKTKDIKQSEFWHPEGNAYIHTKLVTNRLANKYHDINLSISGLLHDLGKIYTSKFDDEKQEWTARGHEIESVEVATNYKNWIEKMGADVEIVEYIIANHMRYKYLDEMRTQEQVKFMNNHLFSYVEKFSSADYGGSGLQCKEIPSQEEIKNKIKLFQKNEEERIIISNKFNGRIIMDKYPDLKGFKLGGAIGDFKNSFDDFKEFALKNTKEVIMNKFDDFYKKYINE